LTLRLTTAANAKGNAVEQNEKQLEYQLAEFQDVVNHQVDELLQMVRNCKPKETNESKLAAKNEAYGQLLKFVTQIIDEMRELIKTIFDRHRLFIHQTWQALNRGEDCGKLQNNLEDDIKRHLHRWERFVNMIDDKINSENRT
jgi:chemotaxis regulatin CheY-phosphate phosphatase CheZ